MKNSLKISFLILLSLLVACHSMETKIAQNELANTRASLPDIKEFETVGALTEDFSYTAYKHTCYYSRSYIIYGTFLEEVEALNLYIETMTSNGWKVTRDDMERTRVLLRGKNESITAQFNLAGPVTESHPTYEQARELYPTIIIVIVDYVLPQVDGC